MKLIEEYYHNDPGYNPFLIRPGWQVAQLNYVSGLGRDEIDKIEAHWQTDEVFILTKGRAILIGATIKGDSLSYEMEPMRQGVTYNIPMGMWHNIAMAKDAEIIIVEKDNTHLNDVEYYYFTEAQSTEFRDLIQTVP